MRYSVDMQLRDFPAIVATYAGNVEPGGIVRTNDFDVAVVMDSEVVSNLGVDVWDYHVPIIDVDGCVFLIHEGSAVSVALEHVVDVDNKEWPVVYDEPEDDEPEDLPEDLPDVTYLPENDFDSYTEDNVRTRDCPYTFNRLISGEELEPLSQSMYPTPVAAVSILNAADNSCSLPRFKVALTVPGSYREGSWCSYSSIKCVTAEGETHRVTQLRTMQ